LNDNVWSVSAPPYPLDVTTGIGNLINPSYAGFSMHDHVYIAPHIPDPTRAVVTYQFDAAAIVDQIEIIQHGNGISKIEALVGNSLGSMTSIGNIFGPSGDVMFAGAFSEGSSQVFDFDNTLAGSYVQFVVTKTNLSNGWGTDRAFLREDQGARYQPASEPAAVPEASTMYCQVDGC